MESREVWNNKTTSATKGKLTCNKLLPDLKAEI